MTLTETPSIYPGSNWKCKSNTNQKTHFHGLLLFLKTTDGTLTVAGASNNEVTLHGVHQLEEGIRYHDLLRKDVPEYIWEGYFYRDQKRNT
jgi:hypothetical protein